MEHTRDSVVYDRQEHLIRASHLTVHVIGCGGVGTWAAIMLALAGVERLHLYDDDSIEDSNLNRLPYGDMQVGRSKTEALTALLGQLRQNLDIVQHGKFQPLLHKFRPKDVVIGAVDTMRDRQGIYSACQEHKARYIDVGAEAHTCTVSDSPADWSIVEDRVGYFTPIWVAPVVVAAALAVSAAVYGNLAENETIMINLKDHSESRRDIPHEQKVKAALGEQPVVGEQGAGAGAHNDT